MKSYLQNWKKRLSRVFTGWSGRFPTGVVDWLRSEGGYFEWQGRRDVIHQALITLNFNGIPGDYAEFGCCGGRTFGYAAEAIRLYDPLRQHHKGLAPRRQWAFDSFAGLPPPEVPADEHPQWIAGTMKTTLAEFHTLCKRMGVRDYETVPGFYKDTLRDKGLDFLPPGRIAFAYVDCDIYHSTLDVLKFLLPRLQHGMIIAFDDYWCYSTTDVSGERRAFKELLQTSDDWHFEPYLSYGWAGMSFVVERKRPAAA